MAVNPVVEDIAGRYGDRVSFQILDASHGTGLDVYRALNNPGHPSYFLIDPDGTERYRSIGFKTEADLLSVIEANLRG
jgi:hypothetical protein